MSSARIPPSPYSSSVLSHSYPTFWYSLKFAFRPFGKGNLFVRFLSATLSIKSEYPLFWLITILLFLSNLSK